MSRTLHGLLLLGLALLVGCGSSGDDRPAAAPPPTAPAKVESPPPGPPPNVTADISKVSVRWDQMQQTFVLTLANKGDREADVRALVYGTNEKVSPPLRAMSPPTTGLQWFEAVGSRDGKLTAQEVERAWKRGVFVSARGGKLKTFWDAKLAAGASLALEAAHHLDKTSPHPAFEGKPLARVGYTHYHVWLFTPEGHLFAEKTVAVDGLRTVEPAPVAKAPEKEKPTPAPVDEQEKAERSALLKLRAAKEFAAERKAGRARELCEEILKQYPRTKAAEEAKKLRDGLPVE